MTKSNTVISEKKMLDMFFSFRTRKKSGLGNNIWSFMSMSFGCKALQLDNPNVTIRCNSRCGFFTVLCDLRTDYDHDISA